MPYRRLPNTDSARLNALKMAFKRGENLSPIDKPYSQSSLHNLTQVLPRFEALLKQQKESYRAQTEKSTEYIYLYKKARNYVSHFFQVLNLAIIRGDLKKEARSFFKLNPETQTIPAFRNESDLVRWGYIAVEGEPERILAGGNPMTNPTMAIVKVHFEKFQEAYRYQKNLQENSAKNTKFVAEYRAEVDRVILQLWNEIEASYAEIEEVTRRNLCREYGITYFFRRNEEIPENEKVSDNYRQNRVVNKDIKAKQDGVVYEELDEEMSENEAQELEMPEMTIVDQELTLEEEMVDQEFLMQEEELETEKEQSDKTEIRAEIVEVLRQIDDISNADTFEDKPAKAKKAKKEKPLKEEKTEDAHFVQYSLF